MEPCTLGVRFQQCPSQCTTAWRTLWRKWHLCKSIVRICTTPGRQIPYGCHRLCTQSGRSLGASYSRCTISATRTADHHPMVNTLAQTLFLYTRCTDLYSSLSADAVRLPQSVYTNWEVPWSLLDKVYDSSNAHGRSPPHGEYCGTNSIFVHPLYGSVQLPDGRSVVK